MAIFSVEIADEDVQRVIDSICINYGWKSLLPDPSNPVSNIPNPESKQVFANRIVREFLSENVKKREIDELKSNLEKQLVNPRINDPQL